MLGGAGGKVGVGDDQHYPRAAQPVVRLHYQRYLNAAATVSFLRDPLLCGGEWLMMRIDVSGYVHVYWLPCILPKHTQCTCVPFSIRKL
jgi:hypothetical protein